MLSSTDKSGRLKKSRDSGASSSSFPSSTAVPQASTFTSSATTTSASPPLISVSLFNSNGSSVSVHIDSILPSALPVHNENKASRPGDDEGGDDNVQMKNDSFVAGPDDLEFEITPHPQYPHTILQIRYKESERFQELRVNYSDFSHGTLAGTPPHAPPGSYKLTGDNPFNLFNLSPGHEYR